MEMDIIFKDIRNHLRKLGFFIRVEFNHKDCVYEIYDFRFEAKVVVSESVFMWYPTLEKEKRGDVQKDLQVMIVKKFIRQIRENRDVPLRRKIRCYPKNRYARLKYYYRDGIEIFPIYFI